jgi:hypothetical protein
MHDLLASVVTEPLEVVDVVLGFAGLHGGIAGAAELIRGSDSERIARETARGAASGFILGIYAGVVTALILAFT